MLKIGNGKSENEKRKRVREDLGICRTCNNLFVGGETTKQIFNVDWAKSSCFISSIRNGLLRTNENGEKFVDAANDDCVGYDVIASIFFVQSFTVDGWISLVLQSVRFTSLLLLSILVLVMPLLLPQLVLMVLQSFVNDSISVIHDFSSINGLLMYCGCTAGVIDDWDDC